MKPKQILLLILLVSVYLNAQSLSSISGSFVDIGFGARPAAMGNAFVGISNDVNSIVWNPAGLSNIPKMQASFTFTKYLGLIDYNYVTFNMPVGTDDGLGAALIVSGDKALSEYTFNVGYSKSFFEKKLSLGVGLKLRYASFGNNALSASDYVLFEDDEIQEGILNQVKGSALGFGLDLGMIYTVVENVNFGIMLKDILAPMSWNSSVDNPLKQTKGKYSESLPFEPTVGSSALLFDKVLLITADYSSGLSREAVDKFRSGVELKMLNMLYLRGGIQHYMSGERNNKYSFGLGLDFNVMANMNVMVDYAYVIENLADTQRFTLSMEF